nr:TonB-dependent receptor [Pseudopedobacter sp.]
MKKGLQIKLYATGLLMFFASIVMAQITTSSLSGTVKDSGGPIPGASINVVHIPTGTKFNTITRSDGRFNIPNVIVGGPFKVIASFVGFETQEKTDVYTTLGENKVINFNFSEAVVNLREVVVTSGANEVFRGDKVNTTTLIDSVKLSNTITTNRNLSDYFRNIPQAKVDGNGAISIAGQNNRFNSISVNGAPINDAFGLAASGTNGGQAASSPIPIDAIDQIQVNVSPFDVRYSGFTGGAINAITKSGTNNYEGGFSYFIKNQSLAGKTPTDNLAINRTKLENFSNKTYSLNLGGPIVKNKLFLFVSGEIQDNSTPNPFDYASYKGSLTANDINTLSDFLKSQYGYAPGSYLTTNSTFKRTAILGKLDWNINDKNRFSLSYNYNKADNTRAGSSNSNSINFANSGLVFPNTANQITGELKSTISNKLSNNLLLIYSDVIDDRNGLGSNFPRVQIRDGSQSVNFGTEAFSTGNKLTQNTFNLINETKLYQGKHTISFIEDLEFAKYYNLFIRQNFGQYTFANLNDFLTTGNAQTYTRSYSLIDNITGDGSAAAADFKTYRIGAAIQDKFEISNRLTVIGALRADYIGYPTKSFKDDFFNNTAAAIIQKTYDLEGARSGALSDSYVSLSPRLSFNYAVNDERTTQIRGGLGLFQGRLPAVWPGGIYTNSGVIIGGTGNVSNVKFRGDIYNQYRAEDFGSPAGVPSGELDLVAKKFRLPKVAKFNLALDQKLPYGINLTIEGDYTRNVNQVEYKNVNIVPPTLMSNGVGSRPIYSKGNNPSRIDLDPNTAGTQNPYNGNMYLLTNTNNNIGYAYTLSLLLDKKFDNGITTNLGYVFNRSRATNDNSSSQNSSQWRYNETPFGRNNLPLSFSDYDAGHRITGYLGYNKSWFKFGGTSFGLVYTGQSGNRYSYVMRNSIVNDDSKFGTNDLVFIPNKATDLVFVPLKVGAVTFTPAEQAAAFDAYINQDDYLSKNRGKFAERNGSRLPFINLFDFHFQQNFFVKTGNKKQNLAFSFDIQNLGNLLNKDWGRVYFQGNDNYSLLTFDSFTADNTPQYQFNPNTKSTKDTYSISDNSLYNSSRWTAQIGLKYFFR